MFRKIRKLSLEKQLFVSFLSVSISLLLLSLSITLTFNLTRQRQEIDKNLNSFASYIASMNQVVSMLKAGYPDPQTEKELDALYENFPDINVIVIYDTDGLRFYHTSRKESGETFLADDAARILSGSDPYIITGYGTYGRQRQAFHAVKDESGTIVGFIMASVFTDYISDQAKALLPAYLVILAIMLIVSVLLSHGIVRLLRASLMGHHPQELLDLYLKQDTVLNAMEEGIIASDRDGTIIFVNQKARSIFPEGATVAGEPLKDLFAVTASDSVLRTGTASYHRSLELYGHPLIVSELPIGNAPDIQGVLSILSDRTEIEALSDELSGTRSMLDTLRAFNHEFLNKLHIILGYLQTGQTDKAIAFIMNSNLVSSQAIRQTADCLRVSHVCALVIGKMMHAAELGILLSVKPDSRCHDKELLLPPETAVTIIGNLLENAIEELSLSEKDLKEISLGVYCSQEFNIITCEDTGRGIPPGLLDHIYERGVSSKGENRGTGLFLIRRILDEYGGEIAVETEEGEGTCFTITFIRKENDLCTM